MPFVEGLETLTLAKLESDLRRNPLIAYKKPRLFLILGVFFFGLFLAFTILHIEYGKAGSLNAYVVTSLLANIAMLLGALYLLVSFYYAFKLSKK